MNASEVNKVKVIRLQLKMFVLDTPKLKDKG